ncbi:MAG: CotH kinase family protein, partial [Candidatus Marinimicrobia bacterium]|nr:CotH kinase family protein [Candidatus Neomarinimicrobiota bacterium]
MSYLLLFIVFISILSNRLALEWRIAQYTSKINNLIFGYNHDFMVSSPGEAFEYSKGFILGKFAGNDLPEINLKIDHQKLLNIFNESNNSLERNYYAADIQFKSNNLKKNFKLKVRGKGDRPIHYESIGAMSFRSNLKGDNRLFGVEEFSIQNPVARNYSWEYLIGEIARDQGLLALRSWQSNFYLNGDYKGVYTIEEVPSKNTIEQQKRKNGPIFGIKESISTSLNTKLDPYDVKEWENNSIFIYAKELLYSSFADALDDKAFSSSIFDFEEWAKFFALMDVFGSYHAAIPKSVKFYFNPVEGKFQPLLFDAHVGAGDFKEFALIDYRTNDNRINCEYVCQQNQFIKAFFINDEFFDHYLKFLNAFSEKEFIEKIKLIYEDKFKEIDYKFYSMISPSDQIFAKGLSPYFFKSDRLDKRQIMLKNKIEIFMDKKNFQNSIETASNNNKFSLPEGVRFVEYHDFDIEGTKFHIKEPTVFYFTGITNLRGISKDQVLHINGPGMFIFESKKTNIQNVFFESSIAIPIKNRNLSGAVNIVKSNSTIENVSIVKSNAEDAINLVSSSFTINNLIIDESFSDAIDLDFSDGEIDYLYCENIGNDCLDISESNVVVEKIKVVNVMDKAISAGENSYLMIKNIEILDSAIGLVSKDGSNLVVNEATIKNVKLPIALFQKKPSYNDPMMT